MSDREEWRAALRDSRPGDCYRHDWARDRTGGGICRRCGLHVTGDEL